MYIYSTCVTLLSNRAKFIIQYTRIRTGVLLFNSLMNEIDYQNNNLNVISISRKQDSTHAWRICIDIWPPNYIKYSISKTIAIFGHIELHVQKCLNVKKWIYAQTIRKSRHPFSTWHVSLVVDHMSPLGHLSSRSISVFGWYEIIPLASFDLDFKERIQNSLLSIVKELLIHELWIFSTVPLCFLHIEI